MIREFFAGFHTEAMIAAWYLLVLGALVLLMMMWTSLSRAVRAQGEEPPFLFCMLMISTAAFLMGIVGAFVEQWFAFAALIFAATGILSFWVALSAALFYPRVWRWTRPGLSAFMQPFIFWGLSFCVFGFLRIAYTVMAMVIGAGFRLLVSL